jgi:hypothetical protein
MGATLDVRPFSLSPGGSLPLGALSKRLFALGIGFETDTGAVSNRSPSLLHSSDFALEQILLRNRTVLCRLLTGVCNGSQRISSEEKNARKLLSSTNLPHRLNSQPRLLPHTNTCKCQSLKCASRPATTVPASHIKPDELNW